jgi:hypothetical protein
MEQEKRQLQPIEPRLRHREIPWWGWLAAIAYMVLVDNLVPSEYEGWALVAGWFALGTMCLANFSSCGRYHCKITGPGFIGLGILALLETVGVIGNLPAWVTYTALIAVLTLGFGLEYRFKSNCGTCYARAGPN